MKYRTNIRQGQIYWLDKCDPLDGDHDKDRPIIVIASPEELRAEDFVLVVACSTHPRTQDVPRYAVPTRFEAIETGLPKPCWAIRRWYFRVNRFRLTDLKGVCPEPLFTTIASAVLDQIDIDSQTTPLREDLKP